MAQLCQQERFAFEGFGVLSHLLGREAVLTHFFDGDEAVAKGAVGCLVHGSEPALADLGDDAIALLEQVIGAEQAREASGYGGIALEDLPTGQTLGDVRWIDVATASASKRSSAHRSALSYVEWLSTTSAYNARRIL